jgi:aminoglycoside phosphotransferase (APT) family kinase protein
MPRDPDELAAGLARWLEDRRGLAGAAVARCERASAGMSSETYLVDIRWTCEGREAEEALVLRLAPAGPGAFPEYDLAAQAAAQQVAAAHGVPTAVPARLERDPTYLGAEFLVMPMVAGHIPADAANHDPWITGSSAADQEGVFHRVLDVLAAVHAIPPDADGLDGTIAVRDVDDEIAAWRGYLDWYGDGAVLLPQLVDALDWCAAHRPPAEPEAALLWGDVRLGNLVFDDGRKVVAVLDWEMTTIGAPEHDVGWFLGLERVQEELLGARVAGFPPRDAAVAYYEQVAGRELVDLAWFEILALVRSAAIMTRLSYLRDPARVTAATAAAHNPLLGVLARRIEAYRS